MGELVPLPGVELPEPDGPQLRLEVFAGYTIYQDNPDGTTEIIEEVSEDKDGNTYTTVKDARTAGKRQLNWFKKRPEEINRVKKLW